MDRQDFLDLMTGALRGVADDTVFGGRLRSGRVKSRILEAHPPELSADGCSALIRDVAERADLDADRLDDALWALLGNEDAFFLDVNNARFWQLHSTASAAHVDQLLRRHFLRDTRLDSAWLPQSQLDQVEGERLWLKSSFASDALLPAKGRRARRWRVQVEGEAPQELLELLSQDERYAPSSSLSGVGSVIDDPQMGDVRVVATYRGAFIIDGTSFELAAGVLWRAVRRYQRYIEELEARHQMRYEAHDGSGLEVFGDVAMIEFPTVVPDMEHFLAGLFSCRDPFRLWAAPRLVAGGQWQANAVDLHIGRPIRLEITDRWLRVLLDEQTCGNTVARLVANLQHHLDARTDVLAAA